MTDGNIASPVPAASAFAQAWAQLKVWAAAEWSAVEGGIEAVIQDVEPVIESDVVAALETFGEDLVEDAVQLLSGGLPSDETIGQVADNLVEKVETQGKTIAQSTAVAAAGQVVAAAQTQLGAMAALAANS
ncbi:MAG: hypothetical protein ABSC92_16195 [Rhizomicrobium sp.]